jgi:hypothetical protein
MVAGSQLVVQYSLRRRLDDVVGLGLLSVATLLSFTGLVDLARYMHPVRFALLLSTVICSYRVVRGTFGRLRFTGEGIERLGPFQKRKRWRYHELVEVREVAESVSLFGTSNSVRLRFSDGSTLNVDCTMTNATGILAFLRQQEHHFTVTLA